MAVAFKYRTLSNPQMEAEELLSESMEVESSDDVDVRPDLRLPEVALTLASSDSRGSGAACEVMPSPMLQCVISDDSGSTIENNDVLETVCDQETLIREIHLREMTSFEQEEAHKIKKQKKKARRKKIRKRLWRAVRTTWKYLKRGFSSYAPTPGIVNSFTWSVNLPSQLFKQGPPQK